MHLLEHQAQRLQRSTWLDNRTPHDGGAEVNGTAILDVSQFQLQHHILKGMKLKKTGNNTVIAKFYRVPVGGLHGRANDGAFADPATHPP